jgi:uncharacterized protein (TIGR00661 family)
MKVLYAIQGTGNGHIARAREIIPILQKKTDLDILISGTQADIKLPFEVKYKLHGLSFSFGKAGGIDFWNSARNLALFAFFRDVKNLPVGNYDLVLNDFEPVTARACTNKKVPVVSMSHQAAVLHENAPRPDKGDWLGEFILKNYAPADTSYGFHFAAYGDRIFTPVIRSEIRNQVVRNLDYYIVYLPAYSDKKIIESLIRFRDAKWIVFSKHTKISYDFANVRVFPVSNELFIRYMADCRGVLCGAGFETPAEVLYMGKKLLVIPMKDQFEQQCNAAALKSMGVNVAPNLQVACDTHIHEWLQTDSAIQVNYPEQTERIIDRVLNDFQSRS